MKNTDPSTNPPGAGDRRDIEEVWGTRPAEPWELAMQQHSAQVAAAASAWIQRWPAHCKSCGGWGASSYEESHGFKGGGTETFTDPCEAPPGLQTCHRCGYDGLDTEGAGPCIACGWNYDDGMPT